MKKILFALIVVLAFASCRKYPDLEELTYKPIVVTNHKADADFSTYQTYYLPDFVGEIGDDPNDSIVDPVLGNPILSAINQNMQNRGYTKVNDPQNADIGIGVVTITVTTIETFYPGYWWGYGWGGYYPYYPYYPYSYTYTYQTGTLIVEMIDLKNLDLINNKVDILWTNFNNSVLGATSDAVLATDAVNQAFKQSPYIQAN